MQNHKKKKKKCRAGFLLVGGLGASPHYPKNWIVPLCPPHCFDHCNFDAVLGHFAQNVPHKSNPNGTPCRGEMFYINIKNTAIAISTKFGEKKWYSVYFKHFMLDKIFFKQF